jgi:hypothetical protein
MNRMGHILVNSTEGERAVRKNTQKIGILAAAVASIGLGSLAHAQNNDLLYDWKATNTATTPVTGYTPAPFVSDANVAAVVTQLTAQSAAYPNLAVKIQAPLSPASTALIFNNPAFTVNYAFLDFEVGQTSAGSGNSNTALANSQAQLIHSQAKGATTYVGNFRLFPGNGDTSGPGAGPSTTEYTSGGSTGVNMANEDLYPGSPFYKNPSQVAGGTSAAPNIRSALFVEPINRATFVTGNLAPANGPNPFANHVPYVNRFNNAGNAALDSDGNPNNGYRFENTTGNQMLSRGDFSAMVAHERLRGVGGVHLLDGGVVGYTQAQFEQDAKDGFTFAPIASIFNGANAKLASVATTTMHVTNIATGATSDLSNESTGVVVSGVYSLTQTDARLANSTGKLALLLSNLDENAHTVTFPNKIGGKNVNLANSSAVLPKGYQTLAAGSHELLEFAGVGLNWTLVNTQVVFADSDRSGVGVPEPVAIGGAAIFAVGMMFRRRRSRA